MEVQRLPLADCGRYGDNCRECILSRDPYCGWDRARRKCIAIPPGYNVTTGYDNDVTAAVLSSVFTWADKSGERAFDKHPISTARESICYSRNNASCSDWQSSALRWWNYDEAAVKRPTWSPENELKLYFTSNCFGLKASWVHFERERENHVVQWACDCDIVEWFVSACFDPLVGWRGGSYAMC